LLPRLGQEFVLRYYIHTHLPVRYLEVELALGEEV